MNLPNKNILIVVDMQNDFIDGALGTKEAQTIIPNVIKKISEALENKDDIIFTRETHYAYTYSTSEEGKNLPVPHCIEGSLGWMISDKITISKPKNHSYTQIFDKETFGSLDLANHLKNFYPLTYINSIQVIGLCTDICVIANAIMAKSALPNAHIIVDASCCAGVSPQSHDNAIQTMKTLQIEILNHKKEPWRKKK